MAVFIGSGLLIGGLLGLRLTVFALVPAAVLALGIAGVAWFWQSRPPDWGPLELIFLLGLIQIGYLCSAAVRVLHSSVSVMRESHGTQENASWRR